MNNFPDYGCISLPSFPSDLVALDIDPASAVFVPFGANVSFACKDGLRFADLDVNVLTVSAKCLGGVNWEEPAAWPHCVHCEFSVAVFFNGVAYLEYDKYSKIDKSNLSFFFARNLKAKNVNTSNRVFYYDVDSLYCF